jgi:hypothetical protein
MSDETDEERIRPVDRGNEVVCELLRCARLGYRFGDYWKLGLPLLALFGVVALLLVPLIWSF